MLHQRGAKINASCETSRTNFDNNSPLIAAVSGRNKELIDYLIHHSTINYSLNYSQFNEFKCAARAAADLGEMEIVRHFIYIKFAQSSTYNFKEFLTELAFNAAGAGHLAILELLIEHGAKIEKPEHGDIPEAYADEPIRAAIANGHNDVVHYLLQRGSGAPGTAIANTLLKLYRQPDVDPGVEQNYLQTLKILFANGAEFQPSFYAVHKQVIKEHKNNLIKARYAVNVEKIEQDNVRLLRAYERTLKALFDFGTGIDFPLIIENRLSDEWELFELINWSSFNFVGLSIRAKPISRDMLQKLGIHQGINEAIFTLNDLNNLPDEPRRILIETRLEMQMNKRKGWVLDNGLVTLSPLARAAYYERSDMVEKKLQAGVDPR